jgi:hypothetical protein
MFINNLLRAVQNANLIDLEQDIVVTPMSGGVVDLEFKQL